MGKGRRWGTAIIGLLALAAGIVGAKAYLTGRFIPDRQAPPPPVVVEPGPAPGPPPGPEPAPAREPIDPGLVRILEPSLGVWLDSWRVVAPGFSLARFERVQQVPFDEAWEPFDKDLLEAIRRPLYVYSPDGTRFVDLYGAMELSEEDGKPVAIFDHGSTVTLYDTARGGETSLASCGSACLHEDAIWLSNDLIALVGGGRSCEANGSCTWGPMILLIDLFRKTESLYLGPAAESPRRAPYFMIRLKQRLPDLVVP